MLDPETRTLAQHTPAGVTTVEAHGSLEIAGHAGLVLDFDDLFANV
ncbi:MAG: hypothetical protein ACLPYS_17240 [Vulcanimicrobiaceae bacterium]